MRSGLLGSPRRCIARDPCARQAGQTVSRSACCNSSSSGANAIKRILVTGGNKGIGLAIAKKLLDEHADVHVVLGSRDAARGEQAVEWLQQQRQEHAPRVQLLQLDVCSDESVQAAAASLAAQLGSHPPPLRGFINNAGVISDDLQTNLNTNLLGPRRVINAFLPLLDPVCGRIVNVASSVGLGFIFRCSPSRQQMLTNPNITWDEIDGFMQQALSIPPGPEAAAAFKEIGVNNHSQWLFTYGISKALLIAYTQMLAKDHPSLLINACDPGLIETDMTRPIAPSMAAAIGKPVAELGLKSPEEGAMSAVHLMTADISSSGGFYSGDAKRFQLDRPPPWIKG